LIGSALVQVINRDTVVSGEMFFFRFNQIELAHDRCHRLFWRLVAAQANASDTHMGVGSGGQGGRGPPGFLNMVQI